MEKVTHGTVCVTVPDRLKPSTRAGRMSKVAVRRLLKAPRGLGQVSERAASALEKAGDGFVVPAGLTPESLREAGARSVELALVLNDLEVSLKTFKQASLLVDYEAYEKLRQLNDLVKAQVKYHPELRILFQPLFDFFAQSARTRKENQRREALALAEAFSQAADAGPQVK